MNEATGTTTIEVKLTDLRGKLPEILIMVEAGIFEFKNGRAILHRDSEGKLRKIDIETTKYKT